MRILMKVREKIREKTLALWRTVDEKFFSQFGFYVKDTNMQKIDNYLHVPKDSSSLAVTRILFGLAMLLDIPSERGGADMEKRWGDPNECHFPLFPFVQAISMPYMALVYLGLWFGALGIMLGTRYRFSSIMFTICYWYLFLIKKSYWNNHSYLFGLTALLLSCTRANCYWSFDALRDPTTARTTVPYWNYFILKYQFFILYFMAGLKKGTVEWLSGHSMEHLGEHWVFAPFRLFLTVPQIDLFIVHWFIFVFDLTIAMWMMYSKTRNIAMVFCALFHLMNSRLFSIGMFPWVCLATMPLFYPFDWPKIILQKIKNALKSFSSKNELCTGETDECALTAEEKDNANPENKMKIKNDLKPDNENKDVDDEGFDDALNGTKISVQDDTVKQKDDGCGYSRVDFKSNSVRKSLTIYFIIFHIVTQAFLPYSHFITKGYNAWTNGLYGYSWDMMVHSWDTQAVIVKVVDNEKQSEFYVDPYLNSAKGRWTRHPDMAYQYARCLRDKIIESSKKLCVSNQISQNLSIYLDAWNSLNGRVHQRFFDPKVDMLKAEWSPFRSPTYVMPLLDETLEWRTKLNKIKEDILTWNNKSDVVFLADFPGYEKEKFITTDLRNVSLTVLEGEVVYQPQVTDKPDGLSYKLTTGENIPVDLGRFHKVYNIGQKPAYYMYTFYSSVDNQDTIETPKLPIISELLFMWKENKKFLLALFNNLVSITYRICKCN